MELQHPRPPEPPVKVPPNEDIPDPLDDPTRGTPDYLPPDSPPIPERDPGTPLEKREPPVKVPPNEDIPDPLDDPTRGTPDYLPPDSPPIPERDPGTPVEKREPPVKEPRIKTA
jgi:hypothetical protein